MSDPLLLLIALVAGIAGGRLRLIFSLVRKPEALPTPPPVVAEPAPSPRPAHHERLEVLLRDAEQASRRLDRLIRRAELLDPARQQPPGVSTADIESDPMEVAVREGLSQGESAESLAEALGVTPAEIEEMISRLRSTAAGSEGSDA